MESHRSPSISTGVGYIFAATLFLTLFLNPCLTAQPYLNQVGNQEATYLTSTKRNDLISHRTGGISISTNGGVSWVLYPMLTDLISIKPTTSSDYMGVALKSFAWGFPTRYVFLLRTGGNQGFTEVLSRQDSIIDIAVHETGKLAASIYDGSSNRRFLYSKNKGGKWDSIYTGLPGAIIFQACYESHLFYRQGNNVYRYQYGDTAATLWMPLYGSLTSFHQMLDENTMVAFSSFNNKFLYTTNRGQNWIIKEAPSLGGVLHQTFVDGKVYRSTGNGVYESADSGSTWTLIAKGLYPKHLQVLSGKLYAVSSILNKSFVTTPDSTYIPPAANLSRKMIMKPGSKFYYAMSGSHPDVFSKYEIYEIDRDTVIPENGKSYLIPKGPVVIPGEVSYPDRIFDLPFRYDTVENKYYVWEGGAEKLHMDFSNSNSSYNFLRAASPQVTCSVTVSAQSHLGMPIISHEVRFMTQDGNLEETRTVTYCDTLGIYSYFHHYRVYVFQWGILRNLIMAKVNLGDTIVYYSAHYKPEFAIEPKQTLSVTKYNQYFRLSHYLTYKTDVDTVNFIDSIRVSHYYKKGTDSISLPYLDLRPHLSAEYHYPMNLDSSLFTQGYTYYYRITATDKSLIPEVTTVPETGFFAVNYDPAASMDDSEVPQSFALEQNYPNPFNPSTTISYTIPKSGRVTLKVYSVLGSEVAVLHDGYQSAGTHSVQFNAADLPSGVYFYRLEAGDQSSTKKLLLLK